MAAFVAGLCVLAFVYLLARSTRTVLEAVDDRQERSERVLSSAERSERPLAAELSGVHRHAIAVLKAVREHPDVAAVRTACLAAVEPIVTFRQAASGAAGSRRPVTAKPPVVPPARWWDGSVLVALALVVPGLVVVLILHDLVLAAAVSTCSALAALIGFRRVFRMRLDVEDGLNRCRDLDAAVRAAGTTRDLQRAYGEYLNAEVGRFLLAVGNGHLPLDDGTRDAARVLALRLEAALPPPTAHFARRAVPRGSEPPIGRRARVQA